MDPNTTMNNIFNAIGDGDWEDAFYMCIELQSWLNKEGFPPTGISVDDALTFLRVTKSWCKRMYHH